MTRQPRQFDSLQPLLIGLLDDQLDDDDRRQLADLLRNDPAARTYYLQYMLTDVMLRAEFGGNDGRGLGASSPHAVSSGPWAMNAGGWAGNGTEGVVDSRSEIRTPKSNVPGLSPLIADLAFPSTVHYPLPTTLGYFSSGWPVAYLVATVVLGVGLLIGASVHVSTPEQVVRQSVTLPSPSSTTHYPLSTTPSTVGRITGMVDCQWADVGWVQDPPELPSSNSQSPIPNPQSHSSLVSLGDKFALSSGLLEITYDSGAKVILQGPVTYEVESAAGGYLSVGKLTAKLEKKPNSPRPSDGGHHEVVGAGGEGSVSSIHPSSFILHPLFSVRTPTATVTDLGTEFGVEVGKDGNTTSHVFRGSVEIQAVAADGTAEGETKVLHENESARVERNSGIQGSGNRVTAFVTPAKQTSFVREIPKQTIKTFDLVDVVAGGDGFSGKRDRGIDPTTGQTVDTPPKPKILVGDGRYHRVEGLPFVDGVFVPNSSRGPVQTDSAGHMFDGFGTVLNETWNYLWAGGMIPVNDPRRAISAVLDGVDYSSSGHGLLYMHANKGITFDLHAIRSANPGNRLVRFRTVVGNTETAAALGFHGNASAKTFIANDFQATKIGVLSRANDLNFGAAANTGKWSLVTPIEILDRAEIAAEPNSSGVGFNHYLKVCKGWIRGTGWNASDTEGQIVQVGLSVRVSSETGATAFLNAFAGQGLIEGYSFTVYLAADGSVEFYNGRDFITTKLVSHPDVWQNVVLTANMVSRTFSIKLDDQPLYTGGYWSSDATRVDHVLIGNKTVRGAVCFNNITLSTLESSTLELCRPECVPADVWVLVDGERRSGRLGFSRASGAYPIKVSIAENDRFLTLVATNGGGSLYWNWVFFGDPQLEMVSVGLQHERSLKQKQ